MPDYERFMQARQEINASFRAGEISERTRDDALRLVDADENQARMLAALPLFPQYGFYVKTGLGGYGPDLDETDMPYTSWEDVASAIATELDHLADFNSEAATITAEAAEKSYQEWQRNSETDPVPALFSYREAWQQHKLSNDLTIMGMNFERLSNENNPAPLYAGRPELRHARIWNLIAANFPMDVSDNSRLYVWECEEDPGTEDD